MVATPAFARDSGVFVQAGEGDRAVRSATIGGFFGVDPFDLPASGRWSFLVEAAIGEWFVHGPREGGRLRFNQFGITPVVRYAIGGFFVEAGIGAALVTPRFQDRERRFSTTFNFGDHVGVGLRFGADDANEVVLRAEHFSNGGIRQPNPGQNFLQLQYVRHF